MHHTLYRDRIRCEYRKYFPHHHWAASSQITYCPECPHSREDKRSTNKVGNASYQTWMCYSLPTYLPLQNENITRKEKENEDKTTKLWVNTNTPSTRVNANCNNMKRDISKTSSYTGFLKTDRARYPLKYWRCRATRTHHAMTYHSGISLDVCRRTQAVTTVCQRHDSIKKGRWDVANSLHTEVLGNTPVAQTMTSPVMLSKHPKTAVQTPIHSDCFIYPTPNYFWERCARRYNAANSVKSTILY